MGLATRGDTPDDLRGDVRGDVLAAFFAAMNPNVAILVTVLVRSADSLPPMHTSPIAGGDS